MGHLLGDVHDAPPLAPLLDVAETLSLGIALRARGGGAGVDGWGASGGGGRCELWGSVAVGARPMPPEAELLPVTAWRSQLMHGVCH